MPHLRKQKKSKMPVVVKSDLLVFGSPLLRISKAMGNTHKRHILFSKT